jgi:hypothetical protein
MRPHGAIRARMHAPLSLSRGEGGRKRSRVMRAVGRTSGFIKLKKGPGRHYKGPRGRGRRAARCGCPPAVVARPEHAAPPLAPPRPRAPAPPRPRPQGRPARRLRAAHGEASRGGCPLRGVGPPAAQPREGAHASSPAGVGAPPRSRQHGARGTHAADARGGPALSPASTSRRQAQGAAGAGGRARRGGRAGCRLRARRTGAPPAPRAAPIVNTIPTRLHRPATTTPLGAAGRPRARAGWGPARSPSKRAAGRRQRR